MNLESYIKWRPAQDAQHFLFSYIGSDFLAQEADLGMPFTKVTLLNILNGATCGEQSKLCVYANNARRANSVVRTKRIASWYKSSNMVQICFLKIP